MRIVERTRIGGNGDIDKATEREFGRAGHVAAKFGMQAHRLGISALGALATLHRRSKKTHIIPIGESRLAYWEAGSALGQIAHLLHHADASIQQIPLAA